METILNRNQLENDLSEGLYEIVVGGYICLIGKKGYIDWMLKEDCFCESAKDDNKLIPNVTTTRKVVELTYKPCLVCGEPTRYAAYVKGTCYHCCRGCNVSKIINYG